MAGDLISLVSAALWVVLGTVTVVNSAFTPAEKRDMMIMNMRLIKESLGALTTATNDLNNKYTHRCIQQGLDDIYDVADINLISKQFIPSNGRSNWQVLGSSIRDVRTSFLNMHGRLNDFPCGNSTAELTTATTAITATSTTKTNTTTAKTLTSATTEIITPAEDNIECSSSEFRCGDGTCIPRYWICDAQDDCQDCSDEKNCTKVVDRRCPDHMFLCSLTGTCIARVWLCDGDQDCPRGEDEENCSGDGGVGHTTSTPSYSPGDIPCEAEGSPVPDYYRCDGTTDCDNCMDEYQCVECPAEFSAVGHQCILIDEVKRTWKEASVHCQRLGGRLAEPRDLAALNCFMKEKKGMRARYWVGGSMIEGQGWLWSGGAPVPRRHLPSGGRHQIYNNRSDKNCLDIMPRRTKSPFNKSNCQTKFRSICQIDYIE